MYVLHGRVHTHEMEMKKEEEEEEGKDGRIALLCIWAGIVARQGCGIGAIFARIDMCI